jgi:hypothetical protein
VTLRFVEKRKCVVRRARRAAQHTYHKRGIVGAEIFQRPRPGVRNLQEAI